MNYKVGDVVFFKGKGVFSHLIQVYNWIEYKEDGPTHVGIITKISRDKKTVEICEALSNGFVSSYYDVELMKNDKSIQVGRTKHKLTYVKKHSHKYLGRGYGFLDIIAIAFSTMTGFQFLKVTGAKKLICSEAVSRILYDASKHKINFEHEYDKLYDMISPIDIYYSQSLYLL